MSAKSKRHEPGTKHARRPALGAAFEQGKAAAKPDAKFLGWRKLAGRERTMAGAFSDGTTVYRSRTATWVGKPSA